jgi:hypothetical protein
VFLSNNPAFDGAVAQSVEHRTFNPLVLGSSPSGPIKRRGFLFLKEEKMNWLVMLLVSFVVPVVQPMVQQSINNVQARVQQRMQQSQPAANQPQYYYDGKDWYCHCNGQWWIWKQQ